MHKPSKISFPIPLIRDIFDQLQGAKIFSTLDMKSGFHQLPIDPRDQEKTAFTCHRGIFEFTRLSMGLSNSSAAFQRAMEVVLKGLLGDICMVYIDDIIIHSRSESDHISHIKLVLDRLDSYNLRLNYVHYWNGSCYKDKITRLPAILFQAIYKECSNSSKYY